MEKALQYGQEEVQPIKKRRAVFLARSQGQQIGKVIYGVSSKTSFSLKYSSTCALKSLKRRSLARLASTRQPKQQHVVHLGFFFRFILEIAIYQHFARCNKQVNKQGIVLISRGQNMVGTAEFLTYGLALSIQFLCLTFPLINFRKFEALFTCPLS